MNGKSKEPRVIMEGGEPTAVILDIEEYRELLARLKDHEDLRRLEEIRREGTRYRPLEEYLRDRDSR
jgi:PHD/YefM family antitoxin component YafN of YafNO toxin-antitoxin module